MLAAAACDDTDDRSGSTTTEAPSPAPPTTLAPPTPFYAAPAEVQGEPGTILRSEEIAGAPAGARGWRIVYVSRTAAGDPVAVSGTIVVPSAPAPDGGRPVVSWAHPTVGAAPQCAPSAQPNPWSYLPGLEQFIAAGYVVVATDYEGLGVPAPVHPYLVGRSEGANVLDAVRAARRFEAADASKRFVVWGHSQGGHAALWAGQLAAPDAPELELLGVAAAAPAGELEELLDDDLDTAPGTLFLAYALPAYQYTYGVDAEALLTADGAAALPELVQTCLAQAGGELLTLTGKFLARNPSDVPPWPKLLADNTPGARRTGAPIFVAQGSADTIVVPATTDQLVARLCERGDRAALQTYPGVSHELIGIEAAPQVVDWIAARFAAAEAPTTCGGGG